MLDLQSCVHFQEAEIAGAIVKSLHRADNVVAQAGKDPRHAFCRGVDFGARDGRRACFLDHFLMTALDRTVAFKEVANVAMPVCQDLELHVAWPFDQSLQVDLGVAEAALSQRAGLGHRLEEFGVGARRQHADAATTTGRLDQDRIADTAGLSKSAAIVSIQQSGTCSHGHAVRCHEVPSPRFVTHRFDPARTWADESRAAGVDALREHGIL